LSSAYRSFPTDTERDGIIKSLQETEDWLYEDSDDERDEPDYTSKLEYLKKLLDPIEKRYKDEIARAKETKAMRTLIEEYRSATELMHHRHKDEVNNECLKFEQWLNRYQQQEGFKNMDPIRWATFAQEAMEKLEWLVPSTCSLIENSCGFKFACTKLDLFDLPQFKLLWLSFSLLIHLN
ncbi:heat shock protein 70 family protein, partial [Tanacetum coccineum]